MSRKLLHNIALDLNIFRNLHNGPVEFFKVSVTVSSPGYTSEFSIVDVDLSFHAKQAKKFLCQFKTPQQGDNVEIRISKISLYLGSGTNCCMILQFSPLGKEANLWDKLYPEIQQFRYVSSNMKFL